MWSNKYERCIMCGTTEIRHHAKGDCRVCYNARRWGGIKKKPIKKVNKKEVARKEKAKGMVNNRRKEILNFIKSGEAPQNNITVTCPIYGEQIKSNVTINNIVFSFIILAY